MKYTHSFHGQVAIRFYISCLLVMLFVIFGGVPASAQLGNKAAKKTSPKVLAKNSTKVTTKLSAKLPAKKTIAPSANKTLAKDASKTPSRRPAGLSDSDKSLEIRGQSRNLSMLLVLKNRHENIDFVKPRDSYHDEIQKTDF